MYRIGIKVLGVAALAVVLLTADTASAQRLGILGGRGRGGYYGGGYYGYGGGYGGYGYAYSY